MVERERDREGVKKGAQSFLQFHVFFSNSPYSSDNMYENKVFACIGRDG